MKKERKSRRILHILLAVALLSPFVLFSTGMQPRTGTNLVSSFLQQLIYPVEYAWHRSTEFVRSSWSTYVSLTNVAEENVALRAEIQQLQARTLDYEEKTLEIGRLREVLGFTQRFPQSHVVGQVVGAYRETPFHTMRIDRGSQHQIKVGMPVVSARGVVGKIIRVGFFHSDVQIITDPNFHIDVLLQRTRVRGVLQGSAGSRCMLRLHRKAEIRIGDTIITSGIVGAFPKGLPVGHVVRISYDADQVAQAITIDPWVDHRRLEEVVVLLREDSEVEKIIDTAGTEWLSGAIERPKGG